MKRRIVAAIALLATSCASLVGCTAPYSGSGTVIEHHHREMWLQPMPLPCGKATCITFITHPESWSLTVDPTEQEEDITVSVDEAAYGVIKDGATVTISGGKVTSYVNP